jgi:beta-glucosidase
MPPLPYRLLFLVLILAALPATAAAPGRFSAYDAQVKPLVAQMTLDEKIGQMTQAEISSVRDLNDVSRLFLGSVLSGGGADPPEGNSLLAWTNLYDRFQQQALKTRLGIPLLYGVDAVHGHNNVLGAVIFPHNIGLGCTRSPDLVERIARITAREVRATGINWTFAPCVAVPLDERWGRTYEGFAEDPEIVRVLGAAAVRGFQGPALSADPLTLLACAKHYVGDGGTAPGTGLDRGLDQGDMRADEATLRRVHLPGYIAAIEAGVGSIMPSYSSWNGVKVSGSRRLLTEMLKEELGFEGFLISDYNAIDQLHPDYKQAVALSINAGMDMAMAPNTYARFITTLKQCVAEGLVPMARIDDAVTRILRVKAAMGLLDKNRSHLADRSLHASFGSAEHRAVAREAVRRSLVLLKNDNRTLPISRQVQRIVVAGKAADDIGIQCGGWTIEWQGAAGNVTTGGTTILAGLRAAVGPNTRIDFARDGQGAAGATVAIAVIGERPYAEMRGDRTNLELDAEDRAVVANLKRAGVRVVVVLISGRPMILGDVLTQADAIVAAWLPGTEGQGVADVLLGDYPFTGKLSFSWPRSMQQIPINLGDAAYDPWLKVGDGLVYER